MNRYYLVTDQNGERSRYVILDDKELDEILDENEATSYDNLDEDVIENDILRLRNTESWQELKLTKENISTIKQLLQRMENDKYRY